MQLAKYKRIGPSNYYSVIEGDEKWSECVSPTNLADILSRTDFDFDIFF